MKLPLEILQLGNRRVTRREETSDTSSGGVRFVSPNQVDIGGRIEYIVTLAGSYPPVKLHCLGKVLRSRPISEQGVAKFDVAATVERYRFLRTEEADSPPAPLPKQNNP